MIAREDAAIVNAANGQLGLREGPLVALVQRELGEKQ